MTTARTTSPCADDFRNRSGRREAFQNERSSETVTGGRRLECRRASVRVWVVASHRRNALYREAHMFEQSRAMQPLQLGRTVATPAALDRIPAEDVVLCLRRHQSRDWGELDAHDREANNQAIKDRTRILSAYTARNGVKFWIITEADRSVTTVLLPEEY